jgi:hypothetical protein
LENALMAHFLNGYKKSILLAIPVFLCALLAAGCDERVEIMRNRDIPVLKHQTWAWRPAPAKTEAKNERPVISRDVIGRRETVAAEPDPAYETVRQELRTAIERQLTEKELTQVSDPAAADFLVDYHFAMRRHSATVARVYPGAYPGLVCGPFGCWREWGYGPAVVGYENIRFREGTFVFDLFEREPKGLAYRAIGLEPPYRTVFTHDQVNDMVHALLKGLKPKGK